jgi:hypothetical protein
MGEENSARPSQAGKLILVFTLRGCGAKSSIVFAGREAVCESRDFRRSGFRGPTDGNRRPHRDSTRDNRRNRDRRPGSSEGGRKPHLRNMQVQPLEDKNSETAM